MSLDDLKRSMDTLKTEMPKNVDLLRKIAEKAQASVGKWDTPLPGEKVKVRVDRKGTKLTPAVVKRRAEKRKMFREAGMVKVNGEWVKQVKGFK